MSGWKFRKHPRSNGKALFTRVNQKSNEMDVVALPGTLLQFRRRKWNVALKLNNFDFLAIAAVCCFFCWKRYKQSSKLLWVYRCRCHFERYDKKWKEKLRLSVNNPYQQTLEMAGKIPGASRRPNHYYANRSEISVPTGWNGKSGIPRKVARLFRKNFQSNCAFNLQLNRSNRKFCVNGKRPRSTKSHFLSKSIYLFDSLSRSYRN